MNGVMVHLTVIVSLCVLGVLIAGIWTMGRPGDGGNRSQQLMRWRVGLQFVAIVMAMLALAIVKA